MRLGLLVGVVVLLSACESLFRGTEQELAIETVPAGAEVVLSDGQRCTTPCRITVPRYQELRARIAKSGCRSAEGLLNPVVAGGESLGRSFDFQRDVGTRLYRSIYDYQLGGAYDIEPAPLVVTLSCGEAGAWPRAPSLTAKDEALLRGFSSFSSDSEPGLPPRY